MRYEIANLGPLPIDFIWGSHPAFAITSETIYRIPAKTGIVGTSSDPRLGAPGQRYQWPLLETAAGPIDMSRALGWEAGVSRGHFATDLEHGRYAVEDRATGEGVLVRFPLDQCPHLWLWLTYGGWRGYHHAIIEPWTNRHLHLADAVRAGALGRMPA